MTIKLKQMINNVSLVNMINYPNIKTQKFVLGKVGEKVLDMVRQLVTYNLK